MHLSKPLAACVILFCLSSIAQGRAIQYSKKDDVALRIFDRAGSTEVPGLDSFPSPYFKRAGGGGRGGRADGEGGGNSHQDGESQDGSEAQNGGQEQSGGTDQTGTGDQSGTSNNEATPANKQEPTPAKQGPAASRAPVENKPKTPSCTSKRAPCVPSDTDWNDPEIGIQNRFLQDGRAEIARLDNIKNNPNDITTPVQRDLNVDYDIEWKEGVPFSDKIIENVYGDKIDLSKIKWTELTVKNREENVDRLRSMQDSNFAALSPEQRSADPLRSQYLGEDTILTTYQNIEARGIIIHQSQHKDLDVLRSNDKDIAPDKPQYQRTQGVNPSKSIRWTDQVMYGWRRAAGEAEKDPKDVELKWIFRSGITNEDTNKVIQAAMRRNGQKFVENNVNDADEIVSYTKGDPDPKKAEAFDAIAGTVHGKRVAQMLREYVSPGMDAQRS